MKRSWTTEQFIERAQSVHEYLYDYSRVQYKNASTKVCIVCKKHGKFWQRPNLHLSQKQGCPRCGKTARKDTKQFIKESKKIHGCKYDYSKVEYKNTHSKVVIICPTHGEFWQQAMNHLQGQGCPICGHLQANKSHNLGKERFIERARKVHGDKFNYSMVEYIDAHTKVEIICPKHGEFWQRPNNHTSQKQGCPSCKESKGEQQISKWLQKHHVTYCSQTIFEKCVSKRGRKMPFDFYLPDQNLCIEFDGRQHFESIPHWGGDIGLQTIQENDNRKNEFCAQEDIQLLRIKYDQDINSILTRHVVI